MKKTIQILAILVTLGQCNLQAFVLVHRGTNDPQSEPSPFYSGSQWLVGDGQAVFGSATNDAGTLAWHINDTGTGGNDRLSFRDNFTAGSNYVKLQSQWNLIFTLKINSAGDVVGNPSTPNDLTVLLNPTNSTGNVRRYNIRLGQNGSDAAVSLGGLGSFYVTGAGSGFHTWQLTRTNPATDTAQLYVDNLFVTNYAGFNDSAFPLLSWGTTSGSGITSSEWALVYLEVPEPSTLGAVAMTAVLGLVFRRRIS